MSRALVTCAKCKAKRFEGEVVYDSILKDFICRDTTRCEKPNQYRNGKRRKEVSEVRR